MYIEQAVEVIGENSTESDVHQRGSTFVSEIDLRTFDDYGPSTINEIISTSVNDRDEISSPIMDRRDENSSATEALIAVNEKTRTTVDPSSTIEKNVDEDFANFDEGGDEKCRSDCGGKNGETMMNDKRDGEDDNDDSFDEDDDRDAAALFGNKLQSIFIRRSTIDCDGEESVKKARELHQKHSDKWIGKKVGDRKRKFRKKHALSFVDTLITLFVVAPLVIGQWRGIWGMMDIHKEYFPEWLCFIVGTSLHVVFAIARDGLHSRFVEKWRTYSWLGRVAYDFVRLVYIYVFCVACNLQWRGGWMIFSDYFGGNIVSASFFATLFATALLTLRAFRNLLAPPFIVVIDQPEHVFHFPTRYNVLPKMLGAASMGHAIHRGFLARLMIPDTPCHYGIKVTSQGEKIVETEA